MPEITSSKPVNKNNPIPPTELKDKYGNIIRESSIQELMHQRGISREAAIEIYRDPK